MTATPRYYNDNAKATAKDKDLVLWSMNNPDYYGEEFSGSDSDVPCVRDC